MNSKSFRHYVYFLPFAVLPLAACKPAVSDALYDFTVAIFPRDAAAKGAILARVESEEITEADFRLEWERVPQTQRVFFARPEGRLRLLEGLIRRKLQANLARQEKLHRDARIRQELAAQEETLLAKAFIEHSQRPELQVSNNEIAEAWRQYLDSWVSATDLQVRHIHVKSLADANRAQALLKNGQLSPAEVAKRFSVRKPSSPGDGELLSTRILPAMGKLPDWAKIVKLLPVGRASESILKRDGYHIYVKEKETKDISSLNFENTKPLLVQQIRHRKVMDLMNSIGNKTTFLDSLKDLRLE